VRLESWLSAEAIERLRSFSAVADRSRRGRNADHAAWLDFVVQSHVEHAELDARSLGQWLRVNEGWPADIALGVADDYAEGRAVLRGYDERRMDAGAGSAPPTGSG
jgi:hypothetical protein